MISKLCSSSLIANENELSQSGWLGKLFLSFEHRKITENKTKTELIDRRQIGPLTVQRPFYPEGSPCHLYVLHPPGGVVGGDNLNLEVIVNDNAHVLITMPGATKFYRSEDSSYINQIFKLKNNAIVEWLPQETILFSGTKTQIKTEFHLQESSKLLAWETICFGRPVMNEKFYHGKFKNSFRIILPNKLGLEEHLKISDGECDVIGNYLYSSTFFAYPVDEKIIDNINKLTSKFSIPVGVTELDGILIVRLLANDNLLCQQYLHQLWSELRPDLLNIEPCPPRIWST